MNRIRKFADGSKNRIVCKNIAWFIFILFFSMQSPTNASNEVGQDGPEKVRLQLKWKHQFQFAGYYAAIEQGYYKAEGIEVELIEASSGANPGDAVFQGTAEFGVSTSDVVLVRAKNQKAVVLATIFQHSPQILIAAKNAGIENVHDLLGKKIALEPHAADIVTYMKDEGVELSDCILYPHSFGTDQLLSGEVDAISAYLSDEPFILSKSDFEYTIISPVAGGIDFYGDVLFCSQDLIDSKPDLVARFRSASLKGWEYAMRNQNSIVQLIYNQYSKRHSIEHLQFEAMKTEKLIMANVVEIGYTNPGRWENIILTYKASNLLDNDFQLKGLLYSDYISSPLVISRQLLFILSLIILAIGVIAFFYFMLARRLQNAISVRHQVEVELIASEEKYRALYEKSSDAILILEKGRFADCNNATLLLLHQPDKQAVLGKMPHELSPEFQPDGEPSLKKSQFCIQMAINNGHYRFEWVHTNSPGNEIWIDVALTYLPSAGPDILYTVWRDISDRKKAEQELENHRINLEKLVEERTVELKEKNDKLQNFHDLFVGREFRIKELRDKVKELETKLLGFNK